MRTTAQGLTVRTLERLQQDHAMVLECLDVGYLIDHRVRCQERSHL